MTNRRRRVFILGAARSGTTLLASLLEKTSFGRPFETHFITKYYKRLSNYGDMSDKRAFVSLLHDVLRERPVMQWKLDLDIDAFYEEMSGNYEFSNIVDKLCLKRNERYGLKSWGDKTPSYLGEFGIIYSLFPDAKFIYMVRDGRDVALSLMGRNWGANNIYSCAAYWKNLNRKNALIEKLKERGQLMQIRYEDLLDDTVPHVKRLYDFLEEEYDEDDIVRLCRSVRRGNYDKWKSRLSERQIKVFDLVAADTLSHFGYETFYPERGIHGVVKLLYELHDRLLHYKFLFETNVIDEIKIRFLGKEPFAD